MVQRYFPDVEGSMISDDSGGWVAHEDYAALKKERNRIKVHLDALAYSVLNAPLSPDTEELAKEVFDAD